MQAALIAASVVLFAVSFHTFYPGLVTYDSIQQYHQSLTGHYVNTHPPLMAATWHLLNAIRPGTELMLALNLALYWAAFGVLAAACMTATRQWWSGVALLMGLFPFLLGFSGVIWKDVLLGASWGLSCSLVLLHAAGDRAARKAWLLWLAALLLVYGSAMRHNAAPAGLVLAAALVMLAFDGRPRRRLAAGLALGLLVLTAVPLSSRALRAAEGGSIEMLISWDLTGISYFSGRNYRSAGEQPVASAKVDCYSPRLFNGCRMVPFPDRADALRRWRAAVAEQPLAYLKHRALVFSMLMRAGCETCRPYVWVGHSDANPFGFQFESEGLHRVLNRATVWMAYSPLGRPFLWLVAALGLTAMAWRRRHIHGVTPALICVSGVLYALAYAAVTPTDEFRYLYWLFFSVVLAASTLLFGSADRGRIRAVLIWVLIPMVLAYEGERSFRHHWPTDRIAPSMETNY